jgi:Ser/Thr protein kinase RdoA (MazF antagonist)
LGVDENAPEVGIAWSVAAKYLDGVLHVERVPKGSSTFVYRITAKSGRYYLRFLKEDASFATEALAHDSLFAAGVSVPRVVCFEHRNTLAGLSAMLVEEIPGNSVEDDWPKEHLRDILRDAGRQLARIHTIRVEGFGWVDKNSYDTLKGEKGSFDDYFNEHLDSDIETLGQYPFSDDDRKRIADLMVAARRLLNVPDAVLVHGDYDVSHIFHAAGKYSGVIDFGEIRGNSRLFDLATFIGFYQDRSLYSYLLEGYREAVHLTDEDLYAAELMALFMLLRFLGKKVNANSREHFFQLAKRQLDRIAGARDWDVV